MTSWTYILLNGFWVFGLAIGLAVFSFSFSGSTSYIVRRFQQPITGTFHGEGAVTRVRAIAKRLLQWELVWLALLFPFYFFPAQPGALVLLALPALWAIRLVAHGRVISRTPFDWAIIFLLFMLLVSTWALGAVVDPSQVTAILFGVGLYYAIVEWTASGPNGKRLMQAFTGFALAGVLLAVIAFLGTNWVGDKFTVLRRITRRLPSFVRDVDGVDGGFNPNEIAGALLWVLPVLITVAIWLWASTRRSKSQVSSPNASEPSNTLGIWNLEHIWPRLIFSLAAGMCAVVFLLTQSRSAFIGFACGLGLLLWLGLPRIRILLISVVVIALTVGVFVGPQKVIDTLQNRISGQSVRNVLDLQTLESRTLIWSHSLAAIEDFPLTGIGVGAFSKVMPVFYPTNEPELDDKIFHAHNIFLQAALDSGLFGLAAYLSIWLVAGATFVKAWRSSSGWAKGGAAGIGAGLLSYFIYGITDVVPLGSWLSLYFWALLALLAALVVNSPKSQVQSTKSVMADEPENLPLQTDRA